MTSQLCVCVQAQAGVTSDRGQDGAASGGEFNVVYSRTTGNIILYLCIIV